MYVLLFFPPVIVVRSKFFNPQASKLGSSLGYSSRPQANNLLEFIFIFLYTRFVTHHSFPIAFIHVLRAHFKDLPFSWKAKRFLNFWVFHFFIHFQNIVT